MNDDDGRESRRLNPRGPRLTRKQFLRLAGIAGGLAASGGALLRLPGSSVQAAAGGGKAPAVPLSPGGEFPIGLWWPPPPFQTTLARYQEIVDAGFTFTHSNNYLWADSAISGYALSMADQVGLQVLVDDARIRWLVQDFDINTSGADFTLTPNEASAVIQQVLGTYQPTSYWSVQNGQLLFNGGSGDGTIGLSRDGADWTDYTYAVDVTPLATGGGGVAQAGIAFHGQDGENAYVWLLSDGGYTTPKAPGYVVKVLFVGGGVKWLTPVPLSFAVTPGTAYHLEIKLSGTTIATSVDGQVVDTMTDSTYTDGRVGFREAGTESALFDNVSVTDPTGKVLLSDDFSGGLGQWDVPVLSGHVSFAGLDIYDEPSDAKIPTLAQAVSITRSLSTGALPYINLLPGYDGGAGYSRFASAVEIEEISFDRYPILSSGEDTGYFQNWSDVRVAALQAGLPAWTFIQSVGFDGHAVPTYADVLWQINISLAYGCKGIQYFTYWTPDPARGEGFTTALLTVDGDRTPLYEAARDINTNWLAPLGKVLLPLVTESVEGANVQSPPAGLPAFVGDGYVASSSGSPAVLGRFAVPGGGDPTRWVLVANYSRQDQASIGLAFGSAVHGVDTFDPGKGEYTAV